MIGPYALNTVYTGDARELAKAIPDESIDLIFCDPVYDRIDDYRWLGQLAERVLKPGASVIAQIGSVYRYDAETAMRESSLEPLPLLAEVYPQASARMFMYCVLTGWKPYIWMSKGKRTGQWVFDRMQGNGTDKHYHTWGDSTAFIANYVERLTEPGAIVLDPFTGGATVPAVCKMLGRDWIAFEIDPATAELARERIANTQPPLFVLDAAPAQMAMADPEGVTP